MEKVRDPSSFRHFGNQRLEFGAGKIKELAGIVNEIGENILLVTGSASFRQSDPWLRLQEDFDSFGIRCYEISVESEPSPELIDQTVADFSGENIHAVVSIGGGSVIDAGKAISAMIPQDHSVADYLEGIGKRTHDGIKVPFIAVPTTAGTGSEATKNAVLSRTGENGFKKSLRHDNFIPDIALIDPSLALGCPPAITASCGMDALTQLLEAYVSTKSNWMTDTLAESGIRTAGNDLEKAYLDGSDLSARTSMSYAAYLSGLCLANAGLGTVHGIAGAFGGLFPVPHGVICGKLLYPVFRKSVEILLRNKDADSQTFRKLSRAGYLLTGKEGNNSVEGIRILLAKLETLSGNLKMNTFGSYGIKKEDANKIANLSDNKNNPIHLSKDDMAEAIIENI